MLFVKWFFFLVVIVFVSGASMETLKKTGKGIGWGMSVCYVLISLLSLPTTAQVLVHRSADPIRDNLEEVQPIKALEYEGEPLSLFTEWDSGIEERADATEVPEDLEAVLKEIEEIWAKQLEVDFGPKAFRDHLQLEDGTTLYTGKMALVPQDPIHDGLGCRDLACQFCHRSVTGVNSLEELDDSLAQALLEDDGWRNFWRVPMQDLGFCHYPCE